MAGADPLAGIAFEPVDDPEVRSTMDMLRAFEYLDTDFDVPLPETVSPPSEREPDPNYIPPATPEEARKRINDARTKLEQYRQQLEQYAEQTRGIMPLDDESTNEVLSRAETIARGRREIMSQYESLDEADKQIEQLLQAATEDPSWWQQALGVAGDALGYAMPVLHALAGPQEIIAGKASQVAEIFSPEMLNEPLPIADRIGFNDIPALFDSDAPIRQRGRQFSRAVGRSLAVAEDIALDTPVLKHIVHTAQGGVIGLATGGDFRGVRGAADTALGLFGVPEKDRDEFAIQMVFDIMTDPLMLAEAGPITKTGKLRELSRVGAGALDEAALRSAVVEMPDLVRRLGDLDAAIDSAKRGSLVLEREWSALEGRNQQELPLADLPRGIYELQLVNGNGRMESARLIKQ